MDEKGGSFGLIGGALERTKAYQNSNTLSRYKGVLEPGSEKTLLQFGMEHGFETMKSTDTLQDDRLLKYTAQKMIPTKKLDEFENPNEIYIITDSRGFDIGTYDASTGKFELSPDIAEANKDMINRVAGADGLEKKFTDPSLGDVLEKLSKGESLVLTNEDQVKNEVVKEAKAQFSMANQDVLAEEKETDEDELENVPDGQKPMVMQIKEKLPNVQIKDVLVISSPDTIVDDLTQDIGIKRGGEPVVIVTAVNKEGGASMDDVYMFQGDKELANVGQDRETVLEIMEQHKDAGYVNDFRDNEKEDMLLRIKQQIEITEDKVANLESQDFASEEDRANAIANEYTKLREFVYGSIDYHDREENETLQEVHDEIKEKEEAAQENAEEAEQEEEDDHIMNRWDSANPYNHN